MQEKICCFCSKICKNLKSLRTHERQCPSNLNRKYIPRNIGAIPWNKGLTKESDERVQKNTDSLINSIKIQKEQGTYIRNKPCFSEEHLLNLSIKQSLHNTGGKSKWYEVAGQKVQGTWERDLALKFEEYKIDWIKPKTHNQIWTYNWKDKIRSYAPDFYLFEYNLWIELKGFWWGNDKEKMSQVITQNSDKKLVIYEKKEYNRIMNGEKLWEDFSIN